VIAIVVSWVALALLAVAAWMAGRTFGWNAAIDEAEDVWDRGYSVGFDDGSRGLSDALQALRLYGWDLIPAVSSHQDEKGTPDKPTSSA
jgi:hypothetical protein